MSTSRASGPGPRLEHNGQVTAADRSPIELDLILDDLRALVEAESPSRDRVALERCARVLADLIATRTGRAPSLIDGPAGPHVHWVGAAPASVLVVGHYDTVFPLGTIEQRPFTVDGGAARGPGVFDMKAGIVQAVHAVATLGADPAVEMLFTADEEVGSGTSRTLIEARAEACGTVLVFEPAGPRGALKIGRKGTGTFRVTTHGRAAHAGLEPHLGVNALVAAAELVGVIATLGDAQQGTTVTPTMAEAGTADNTVPAEAAVTVDVRVTSAAEAERVTAAMNALSSTVRGATVSVDGGLNRPPMPTSAADALLPVARAAAAASGLGELEAISVGGGSDGNFTAARGIPTLDGLGAVGDGAHADHEHVLVDRLVPRATFVAELLRRLLAR